jgi:hypothetical protein
MAGDKDTGDIFPGIDDTSEQLSPVTTTLVINLSPVSSKGNDIETKAERRRNEGGTKAERSFDLDFVFNIEAK